MFKSILCIALLAIPALGTAQTAGPPHGFAGSLVSVAGDVVTLKGKDGKEFVVQMTPGWTVSLNRKVDIGAIKPGAFIASQNVPSDASTGNAIEVRILEPGYRPEEGTHAVSATNANMMTHGTVETAVAIPDGVALDVTYPGGARHLVIGVNTPVTISDPLDRSALKAGVSVAGVTRPGADGADRAGRLQLTTP